MAQKFCISVLACWIGLGSGASAQIPTAVPATATATGTLALRTDADAKVLIDGEEAEAISAGQVKKYFLVPGEHFLEILDAQGNVKLRKKVVISSGQQVAEEVLQSTSGSLPAKSSPPHGASAQGGPGVVEGFVTNSEKKPIKGAEVAFSNYVASHAGTDFIPYATTNSVGVIAVTTPPKEPTAVNTVSCTTDSNGQYKCQLPSGRYRPSIRLGALHFVRGLSPQAIEVRQGELARVSFSCNQQLRREMEICHVADSPATAVSAPGKDAKPAHKTARAKNALLETGPE